MNIVLRWWRDNPTRVVGILVAAINLAVALGVLTPDNAAQWTSTVVATLVPLAGAEVLRPKVWPDAHVAQASTFGRADPPVE